MQLVLGARVGSGLGAAGTPLPAPPPRWPRSENAKRMLRRAALLLAFAGLAALGALHGATLAIGAEGVSELASAPPRPADGGDVRSEREVRGSFWRPQRSNASRPPVEIAPRRWQPKRND
jgi:hypothetical protein